MEQEARALEPRVAGLQQLLGAASKVAAHQAEQVAPLRAKWVPSAVQAG